MTNYLIIDVASAPIADAAEFMEPVKPPKNYKDQAKIDAYIAETTAERLGSLATDIDLARLTAVGCESSRGFTVTVCKSKEDEREALEILASDLRDRSGGLVPVITYGGHNFDLPLLMRRARYLGVKFPTLSTDRYKGSNVDLLLELSDRNPARYRPLGFYARRLGMDVTKPLTGEQESKVHETGQWAELELSVRHDLEVTRRLAEWLGVVHPVAVPA